MAVDFYIGRRHCLHLTYASFSEIADRLAGAIGVQLEQRALQETARTMSEDQPLLVFLQASGYENFLRPEECLAVKRRVQEIASGWPEGVCKQNAMAIAAVMSEAAFCGDYLRWTF